MTRQISMRDGLSVAERAAADIERWLRRLPHTQAVQNVEHDPTYQARDIDLLWTTTKATYTVEVKGDRWHRTGNFFFETSSNRERGTPGCFLYSEADLLFYYFVVPQTLYILPLPAARTWFLAHLAHFQERTTTTPIATASGARHYTTVGRLVPIETLCRALPQVKKYTLAGIKTQAG